MKRYFFLSIFILSVLCVHAKNPKQQAAASDTTIYTIVDTMPEFPGGSEAMKIFLTKNLKWPIEYGETDIQGRVIAQFVVEEDGTLTRFVVVKELDPLLDKEAIRVLSIMPKWNPGILKGKKVRVRFTIPVSFRMQ